MRSVERLVCVTAELWVSSVSLVSSNSLVEAFDNVAQLKRMLQKIFPYCIDTLTAELKNAELKECDNLIKDVKVSTKWKQCL